MYDNDDMRNIMTGVPSLRDRRGIPSRSSKNTTQDVCEMMGIPSLRDPRGIRPGSQLPRLLLYNDDDMRNTMTGVPLRNDGNIIYI